MSSTRSHDISTESDGTISFSLGNSFFEPRTEPQLRIPFPFSQFRDRLKMSEIFSKKNTSIFKLIFHLHLHNYMLGFSHQGAEQHLFNSRGLFSREMVNFDLCIGSLVVQNCQELILFLRNPFIRILIIPSLLVWHPPSSFQSLGFNL